MVLTFILCKFVSHKCADAGIQASRQRKAYVSSVARMVARCLGDARCHLLIVLKRVCCGAPFVERSTARTGIKVSVLPAANECDVIMTSPGSVAANSERHF